MLETGILRVLRNRPCPLAWVTGPAAGVLDGYRQDRSMPATGRSQLPSRVAALRTQLFYAAYQCQTTDTLRSSSTSPASSGAFRWTSATAPLVLSFARALLTSSTSRASQITTLRAHQQTVSPTTRLSPPARPRQVAQMGDSLQRIRAVGIQSTTRSAALIAWLEHLVELLTTVALAPRVQQEQ